ncbi:MAG: transposase [Chloroflexi bacterium]|nr:transposase [Chloroflexota bacterium]
MQANRELTVRIRAVQRGEPTDLWALRVQAELRAQGERVGKQRIARLMREMGLQTKGRRRFKTTTQRDDTPTCAERAGGRFHGQAAQREVAVGHHLHRDTRAGCIWQAFRTYFRGVLWAGR